MKSKCTSINLDKIELSMSIRNILNTKEILNKIQKRKHFFNKNVDKFKEFFSFKIKTENEINKAITVMFYPFQKKIKIIFNIQRFFSDINIFDYSFSEAIIVVNNINNVIEKELGIKTNILKWTVSRVEIKKDFYYETQIEMEKILLTHKKNKNKGRKKEEEYKKNVYKHDRNGKVVIYDKTTEIKINSNKNIDKNIIRAEVGCNQKRLEKILKCKNVTFSDILQIKNQEKVFKEEMRKEGFVGRLLTKYEIINKIKNKKYHKNKEKNLIKFIILLNKIGFYKVKQQIKSAYRYWKLFTEKLNIYPYYLTEDNDIIIEKMKDFLEIKKIRRILNNNSYIEEEIYNDAKQYIICVFSDTFSYRKEIFLE